MDKGQMDFLITKANRDEFEAAVVDMSNDTLDELVFELSLRRSVIDTQIKKFEARRQAAALQRNAEDEASLLTRLASMHSAYGWTNMKLKIAKHELQRRYNVKGTDEQVARGTILAAGEGVEAVGKSPS